MGSCTENSVFFATKNPANVEQFGGSSGVGSATILAGMVPLAISGDTGEILRVQAIYRGCVGFQPPYGCVSPNGLFASDSFLYTIRNLTNSPRETSEIVRSTVGSDRTDATSADAAVYDYVGALRKHLDGVNIGIVEDAYDFVDEGGGSAIESAVDRLRQLGAETQTVSLKTMQAGTPRMVYCQQARHWRIW